MASMDPGPGIGDLALTSSPNLATKGPGTSVGVLVPKRRVLVQMFISSYI